MESKEKVRLSKFLSLVLRHEPGAIGLELDPQGWAPVDELLRLANAAGKRLTRPVLEEIVAENDKKRFAFSADGSRIRASQGHSVEVDLGLEPTVPPPVLFHGTASRFVASIRAEGLKPGTRRHVHLSADEATAVKVGARHGKPTILHVKAGAMHAAGFAFFVSANGVWLTERVPTEFIDFPTG